MSFKIGTQDDGMPDFEELQRIGDEAERRERGTEKPIIGDDVHLKTINHIVVSESLWHWLKDAANACGLRIDRFVVYLLETQRRSGEHLNSPEVDVLRMRYRSDEVSEMYADAFRIAINFKNYPADENEELLVAACEKLGITLEDIIRRVSQDPFPELMESYRLDDDSKINQCTKWLAGMFKSKDEIPSRVVNEAGEKLGFNRQMISSARRRIGIKSRLRGGEWYMVVSKSAKVLMG